MRCPDCGGGDLKVTDSRENVESVRRRRECNDCGRRFTTYERLEQFTCARCETIESRIVAIEQLKSGVRRVRECLGCGNRFSTSERPDMDKLLVIKRNGQREEFNRTKIFEGVRLACLNRPVSARQMEAVVDAISSSLLESGLSEVPARRIGDMAMEELRKLDDVAYVRFASVYRRFEDVDSMARMIGELKKYRETRALEDVQPRLIPDQ
ncbi:MAG: transcriptional regulator NrdR [Chloroflexi bacterium]|nr:transcriptional regulator NrdR [Chloroflexota bacterium]